MWNWQLLVYVKFTITSICEIFNIPYEIQHCVKFTTIHVKCIIFCENHHSLQNSPLCDIYHFNVKITTLCELPFPNISPRQLTPPRLFCFWWCSSVCLFVSLSLNVIGRMFRKFFSKCWKWCKKLIIWFCWGSSSGSRNFKSFYHFTHKQY